MEGEGRSVLAGRCPRPLVTLFHLQVGGARLLVLHLPGTQGERGRGWDPCPRGVRERRTPVQQQAMGKHGAPAALLTDVQHWHLMGNGFAALPC